MNKDIDYYSVNKRPTIDQWSTPNYLHLLTSWSRRGLSRVEIAEKMEINISTLTKWQKKSKAIAEALEGKEIAICEIENALFREALGYYYTEEVVTYRGEVIEVRKYKCPSLAAQIFFLKNRAPENWSDKREIKYVDQTTKDIIVKWGKKNITQDKSIQPTSSSGENASEQS